MSRNARNDDGKMRSTQTTVQVFLLVAGIGLLVAGLGLAASGASVGDAADTISDKWGDSGDTGSEPVPDGSSGADDGDSADGDDSAGDSNDGSGDTGGDNDGTGDGDDNTGSGDGDNNDGSGDGDNNDGSGDGDNNDGSGDGDDNDGSADTHTLTVTVEDDSGDAVEGATVSADATNFGNSFSGEATTNDDGEATFEVEDGNYDLTVTAAGYEDAEDSVRVNGGDEDQTVTLESTNGGGNDDGNSDGTSTLTVYAVDGNGTPVEDASVEVAESGWFGDNYQGTTNDDGEATFDLEDGEYDLTVTADGYQDAEDSVQIDGENDETLIMLEQTSQSNT